MEDKVRPRGTFGQCVSVNGEEVEEAFPHVLVELVSAVGNCRSVLSIAPDVSLAGTM